MDSSGENLHGKVINGPWCLKMAFGLILLSFLLSFCYRFVSRKFSPFVGDTYTWSLKKDGGASAAAFELPEVTLRSALR